MVSCGPLTECIDLHVVIGTKGITFYLTGELVTNLFINNVVTTPWQEREEV